MASPPDNSSILSGNLSTSPKTIRGNSEHSHSPVRHRSNSGDDDLIPRPRLSPTLTRSYNPNDPDVRERQRAMDADMAMHLSRARSNTVTATPTTMTSPPVQRTEGIEEEPPFTGLSRQEQQDLEVARGISHIHSDNDEAADTFQHAGPAPEVHLNHLSSGHDPALLVSMVGQEHDDVGGLPMYQASVPVDQQGYDFSLLESFARDEKTRLGIHSPTSPYPPDGPLSSSHATTSTIPSPPERRDEAGDFSVPMPAPRARQRKLSQSTPGPRRAKMALFEHNGGGPPSALGFRSGNGTGHRLGAIPSYENLPSTNAPDFNRQATSGSGHDRPYRFSFYSNALSATIHARSLSELPAEGQTFEDLFLGVHGSNDRPDACNLSRPGTSMGFNGFNGVGAGLGATQRLGAPPIPITDRSGISKMSSNEARSRAGTVNGPGQAIDGNTWWLDVQCPTDDEMKLLSKVCLPRDVQS